MIYLKIALILMIGILIGWFIFGAKKTNGKLYVIKSKDPCDPDIYRFEIDELENLARHKKIIVKVKTIVPD